MEIDDRKDALDGRPGQMMKAAPRAFSLMPQTLGEAKEIATMIANSDFAPKDYKGKPDNVIVAIQMGADLGLKPLQSLQNIAVINGRPSLYGDAALALVMPDLERFVETFEGKEGTDEYTAVCIAKRKGWPDETKRTFSIADAKKANLWGKAGPWTTYYKRMMQFRARGFTLRDVGADRLLGLVLVEEAMDYPNAIDAQVVSSVEVVNPAIEKFQKLPEPIRDKIELAFETLALSPGARVTRINEFLGAADVDLELGAQGLLTWCRDEYAKRKTGQPVKRETNAKEPAAQTQAPAGKAAPDSQAPPASTVAPGGGETAGAKLEPVAPEGTMLTKADIKFDLF